MTPTAPAAGMLPATPGVDRDRLRLRILTELRDGIVEGRVAPGGRLPSEAALAVRFKVSRPVVREALAALQGEGLVTVRRGSGSYARERPEGLRAAVAPLASLADLASCFEIRAALEPAAAAWAARRGNSARTAEIAAGLARLEALHEAGRDDPRADLAFHMAVAQASGNPYFAELLAAMGGHIVFGMQLIRHFGRHRPRPERPVALAEHRGIAAAIAHGDAAGAEAAMAAHIERTRERVFQGDGAA